MDRSSQLPKRIYRANMQARKVYITLSLVIIVLMIILIGDVIVRNLLISQKILHLFVLVLCVFVLYIISIGWNARLEVSQQGVAYCGGGLRIYTPWQNITRIARVRYPHKGTSILVNAFLFKTSALLNVPVSEGKRRGIAVIEAHWSIFPTHPDAYTKYLPIFADDLLTATDISQHEIAIYIHQYAPQVFEESLIDDVQGGQQ